MIRAEISMNCNSDLYIIGYDHIKYGTFGIDLKSGWAWGNKNTERIKNFEVIYFPFDFYPLLALKFLNRAIVVLLDND